MHALVDRRARDLRGREPDALVDDVHAGVARADGDLLGAVGVPVEPGLADQDLQRAPERLADARDLVAQLLVGGGGGGVADAGRRAVGAEDVAQRARPLAGRHAGAGGGQRRLHDVLVARGDPPQLVERRAHVAACGAPRREPGTRLGLDARVDDHDPAVLGRQRRGLGLDEPVHAHQDLLARLDPRDPLAVRLDQRGLHVRHGLDRPAALLDARDLLPRAVEQLVHEPVHHDRALEDVGVVEQVGLVGQHLLDPQRPLLVPRPRQPERLVPGRQLHGPRAGVAAQGHRERLEHDPLHVVLGLGLGQAERVDLDAVAEAQRALVGHAVARPAELLPQHGHRAQLRVLLDEAHAGVDEERDPPEDRAHPLLRHPLADRVEHRLRGRHRERDLLHRRRARLLQVVRADVDRVPARHVLDGVGDHVRDQPHRRLGREGVRPAREVLLDDVVLGRARSATRPRRPAPPPRRCRARAARRPSR